MQKRPFKMHFTFFILNIKSILKSLLRSLFSSLLTSLLTSFLSFLFSSFLSSLLSSYLSSRALTRVKLSLAMSLPIHQHGTLLALTPLSVTKNHLNFYASEHFDMFQNFVTLLPTPTHLTLNALKKM